MAASREAAARSLTLCLHTTDEVRHCRQQALLLLRRLRRLVW